MARVCHLLICVLLVEYTCLVLGEWDYIVVGAGASGCTAASQFAATGKKVLVLEAGGRTAWAFGGRDRSASFGTLDSSTVFDVPGENEKLRKKEGYWWQNIPWGLNGKLRNWLLLHCIQPLHANLRDLQFIFVGVSIKHFTWPYNHIHFY